MSVEMKALLVEIVRIHEDRGVVLTVHIQKLKDLLATEQ